MDAYVNDHAYKTDPGEMNRSSMRILDQKRYINTESYTTLYLAATSAQSDPDYELDQDVKIWIPVSRRI